MASAVDNAGTKGWLVAILELGAWFGVLCTGTVADKLSRKYTIVLGGSYRPSFRERALMQSVAVVIFCIGVIVQTAAFQPSSIYGGLCFPVFCHRFIDMPLQEDLLLGLVSGR